MNEKPKNREWVKNAAIIFLAVLLVLTFFSNTIMNRSLPEVATQMVTSGSVTARVRGTGTVVANGNHEVKAETTRVIRSVLVKAGQQVETGDVLFTLGEGSSEEIEAAEKELRQLQASYNRSIASMPYSDYTTEERKLKKLKEEYDEAKKAYDNALKAAEAVTSSDQLEEVEKSRDLAKEAYETAKKAYDEVLESEQTDSKSRTQLQEKQKAIIETLVRHGELDGDLLDTNNGVYEDRMKITIQIDRVKELIKEQSEPSPEPSPETSPEPPQPPAGEQEEDNSGSGNENNLDEQSPKNSDSLIDDNPDNVNSDSAKAPSSNAAAPAADVEGEKPADDGEEAPKSPVTGQKYEKWDTHEEWVAHPEDWKEGLEEALDEYDDLEREIYLIPDNLTPAREAYEAAKAEYEKWENAYLTLISSSGSPESESLKAAKQALDTAKDAYLTAKESLEESKNMDARSAYSSYVSLQEISEDIEIAKKKLEDLLGGEDKTIVAKVSGTVQSVEATAGDTKKKDDILCIIEVPDMGYTMSFSVTNDQANRLRIGDTATVSNFYWGNEIKATLNSIKIDPKSPQTNKLLTFDLDGNVTAGSDLTISVGQKSATYDLIVPSSAIRSDANGSFVLRVDAKSSPLGNRYIAHRVPVEVLASDDTSSAVTGELSNGDYVITTSTAPIKTGDMVRLANS